MAINGKQILSTYRQLAAARQPFEKNWKEAYAYTYPLRGQQFYSNQSGDTINSSSNTDKAELFDTTAKDSVRLVASSLLSGLTPSNSQWFTLGLPSVLETSSPKAHIEWLQESAAKQHQLIHSSNYDAEAYEFMVDVTIGGMDGLYVEMDSNNQYKYEVWPHQSLYVQDSLGKGFIDTVYRCVYLSASQIVEKFGAASLTKKMADEYNKDPTCCTKHKLIQVIRPRMKNGKQATGVLTKALPFENLYICESTGAVLYEGGYHEMPVLIPRWHKIPNSDYAVGLLDDALPDVKTLNYLVKMMLTNTEMKVSGMWIAKDDGVINPNTIKIGPRRIVFANDVNNFKPITPGGDFNIAAAELQRLQTNIRRVMMADQLSPQNDKVATAYEVQVRVQLVRQLLGPIFARFQSEFLQPLIKRTFGLAYRAGLFGKAPAGLDITKSIPQYTSPLARAAKMEDFNAIQQFENTLASVLQISPEAADLYDFDKSQALKARLLGVPETLMRDVPAVKKIREARAAQRQAEQEAAMTQNQVA